MRNAFFVQPHFIDYASILALSAAVTFPRDSPNNQESVVLITRLSRMHVPLLPKL